MLQYATQLPGGQITPSDNFKKMSLGIFHLIWVGMGVPLPKQKRKWGVSLALRELQCTIAAKAKKVNNSVIWPRIKKCH